MTDSKSLVLAAVDIVQLIGRTVGLKRNGKDFVGLCPFHSEKTPSFHVSPDRQFFYCYGCKKGGNAIDFVIERDRVEFIDALRLLADEARIELPTRNKQQHGERMQLLDAHVAAVKAFRRLWLDPRAKVARKYMADRGFTDSTIGAFAVGYAPDAWDALRDAPEMKPFAPALLQQAGLLKVSDKGQGHYDTFRDRVIFPIRDETGKTIAFGGRVLPGSDNPAKYLNSPETPLFSKSRCIFGIDQARARIVETRTAVIVEGYTDVMMAHQYDVKNVVSVLGTALTEPHVNLLRRFADRIVLLFDADTAGSGATDRSLELFLTQPIEIAIATLPEGKDPDEVLIEQGKSGFEGILQRAQPALEYLWSRLAAQYASEGDDLTSQAKTIDAFLARLASVNPETTDRMRLSAAMVRASKLTQIPTDDLIARVRSLRASQASSRTQTAQSSRESRDGAQTPGQRPGFTPRLARARAMTARERVERELLGGLLLAPDSWNRVQQSVKFEEIATPGLRELAAAMWDTYRNEGALPLNELLELLAGPADAPVDLKPLAAELASDVGRRGQPATAIVDLAVRDLRAELDRQAPLPMATSEDDLLRQAMERARRPDLKR